MGKRDAWTKKFGHKAELSKEEVERAILGRHTGIKYGNRKAVSNDGTQFHSEKERDRYEQLSLLQRAGAIRDLNLQVRFGIIIGGVEVRYASGRLMSYTADFTYHDVQRNEFVIEDTKGFRTKEYKIKKALMAAMGYTITET